MHITAQWQGNAPEAALLRLLQAELPMRDIARRMETAVLQHYNRQQDADGIAWLPSARAKKYGGKTLIDTGKMLASLSYAYGADWAEAGYPQGGVPRWLHFGVPQNRLPPRRHLGLSADDKAAVAVIVADYFERLLK